MSHFTVAVIHKEDESVEDLLAPFQENNMGDCPEEYLEFQVEVAKDDIPAEVKKLREEHYKDEPNKTDEQVLEDWHGGHKNEDGDWGYITNPNSRWDWYQIGGRWKDALKLKEGATPFMTGERSWLSLVGTDEDRSQLKVTEVGRADSAFIKDVAFEPTAEEIEKAENTWQKHLERTEAKEEGYNSYWEYGIEKDDTKEKYIDRVTSFSTYSVLEDGEWMEAGQMGWFGMGASGEAKESWNKSYPEMIKHWQKDKPDYVITIVDCHV